MAIHEKSFITRTKGGCRCGHVVTGTNRKETGTRLLAHIIHPSTANKIAPTVEEHQGCTIESWGSGSRWSVCVEHNVYLDNLTAPTVEQTEVSFT